MPGKAASNQIDFLQLPRLQKQFFSSRSRKENVDRRIDPLIADLAIEHHLHVPGALEFLENQFVHSAAGFDQGGSHDRERSGLLGVARRSEDFSRNLYRASIDTAANGSNATGHR